MAALPCPRALFGLAMVTALFARTAGAAPPPAPPPPAAAVPPSDAEAEARAHFNKGNDYFEKQQWFEALGEFRAALSYKKTRATIVNEASCLKQLGRYDEALEVYEALLQEFPDLTPQLEAKVIAAVQELRRLVGTVSVTGDAPAGASIYIDDRLRGKLPLPAPLRVGVGRRVVRVEKERFEPIVSAVTVDAGKETIAKLAATSRKGLLEVRERHGWALDIEVDGHTVGVTPWEGLVDPGDHTIKVKGFLGLDTLAECALPDGRPTPAREGAKMASPAVSVAARLYEVTPVTLAAEELDASLHIESTPSGASITIDTNVIGRTPWDGRLPLGEHTVEIAAPGFFPAKQGVRLERRKQRELQVTLEAEPNTAGMRLARNIGAGVGYGIGALGLGAGALTGGLASKAIDEVRSRCGGTACPSSEKANVDAAATLGALSTASFVVGGLGVAVGTASLLVLQTKERPARVMPSGSASSSRVTWSAGVGLGGFTLEGSF